MIKQILLWSDNDNLKVVPYRTYLVVLKDGTIVAEPGYELLYLLCMDLVENYALVVNQN